MVRGLGREYSDPSIEQGLLQAEALQTETMAVPFHYAVDQALDLSGNHVLESDCMQI